MGHVRANCRVKNNKLPSENKNFSVRERNVRSTSQNDKTCSFYVKKGRNISIDFTKTAI